MFDWEQRQICTRTKYLLTWWCHQLETFSALLVPCEGNPPITGGYPHRPVTWSFDLLLWSAPEQTIQQTIETQVIWETIAFIMTSLYWHDNGAGLYLLYIHPETDIHTSLRAYPIQNITTASVPHYMSPGHGYTTLSQYVTTSLWGIGYPHYPGVWEMWRNRIRNSDMLSSIS